MLKSHTLGKIGEALAYRFLTKNKYKILKINYFSPFGEIDIIAKFRKMIVFVEVKTRSTYAYNVGLEAINKHKIDCIKKTANCFLENYNKKYKDYRFDVISIVDDKIEHIENAF